MGLEGLILASRLGFGPRGWEFGLKNGIWASKLEFESAGMQKKKETKKRGKENKFSHGESIGRR